VSRGVGGAKGNSVFVRWKTSVVFRESAGVENYCRFISIVLGSYFYEQCGSVDSVVAKTYQFLWADVAAVVSSPSGALQLLSLALRSDQTHSLLSPAPPYWEVLSLATTCRFCG
jgi:hypothetical protein